MKNWPTSLMNRNPPGKECYVKIVEPFAGSVRSQELYACIRTRISRD